MSNDSLPQHSGSRWEPPPTTDPLAGRATPAAAFGSDTASARPGEERGRRRRGPLLAVLAAVLTLGASAVGIAYVQAAQEPGTNDPAAVADSPHDRGPGLGAGDDDAGRATTTTTVIALTTVRGLATTATRRADGTTGELPS